MAADLPAASFRSTLAGVALRFSYGCSHQLRCHRFMSLVKAHAGHTSRGCHPRAVPRRWPIARTPVAAQRDPPGVEETLLCSPRVTLAGITRWFDGVSVDPIDKTVFQDCSPALSACADMDDLWRGGREGKAERHPLARRRSGLLRSRVLRSDGGEDAEDRPARLGGDPLHRLLRGRPDLQSLAGGSADRLLSASRGKRDLGPPCRFDYWHSSR